MKRGKANRFNPKQLTEQDADVIQEIKQGLNKMDDFPIHTPNLQWFEQLVLKEKQQIRKKLMRDLLVFSIVAFGVLSVVIISLYHMPAVFIGLQIATTLFIAIYSWKSLIKKVNMNEE